MSELTNIKGGITSVSSDNSSGRFYYYEKNQPKQKHQFTKLRTGEIVQGLILEEPKDSITEVRLPVGIFKTELQGNLKKGDELFFKIEETNPTLILKIHSVSLFQNKQKRDLIEIIRILDLPTDEDFKKIIKEYTELKFKIIRDEIFRIYKLLLDYAEPVENNSFSPNDIKNAIFLLESGLLKDKSTFTIFSDFFRESKSYSEAVETIKAEIMNFDDKLRDTLISYLAKNTYSNSPLNRISVVV